MSFIKRGDAMPVGKVIETDETIESLDAAEKLREAKIKLAQPETAKTKSSEN